MATKCNIDKRAIALNIMQELHNLQPPGRFLIEACRDGRSGSILSKNRVEAIEKIMHSLREKVKELRE